MSRDRRFAGIDADVEQPNDNELIQQSLQGHTEAFDQLVHRYHPRLVHSLEHALGSFDDAVDVAQQAFLSAWRNLSGFRQDSSFYSWLYRIAINAAISRKRRQRLSTTSLDRYTAASGVTPVDASETSNPEHRILSDEQATIVREALLEVSEEFRQPLVLKEMDGFTYEQIAEILDIPIGTVRSRIFRARQDLTQRLQRLLKDG